MSIPGYTKEESINTFLEALRDSSNKEIFPQIEGALYKLGLTRKQIEHYKMTGKRMQEWSDFEDEMAAFDDETRSWGEKVDKMFDVSNSIKTKRFKVGSMMFLMAVFFILIAVGFGVVALTTDSPKDIQSELPTITESSSVQDGDKL